VGQEPRYASLTEDTFAESEKISEKSVNGSSNDSSLELEHPARTSGRSMTRAMTFFFAVNIA
jgi:hypothetical protein